MPFTPFHMGPGLAVKAGMGRRMSLMVFGFSQVAIDIEPLIRLIRGDAVVHGFTHTFVGATLIGAASVLLGRPVCQLLLDHWRPPESAGFESFVRGPAVISWPAAAWGAFIGTYSHVVLDAIMHADTRPLAPFSDANAFLGLLAAGAMHFWCAMSGAAGAVFILGFFTVGRILKRLRA
jgi:hypothetical protein